VEMGRPARMQRMDKSTLWISGSRGRGGVVGICQSGAFRRRQYMSVITASHPLEA
jgi:hypothetical protein